MGAPFPIETPAHGAWTQRGHELTQLFEKLAPALQAISRTQPDAFADLTQMVAETTTAAATMDRNPSIPNAKALRRHWAKSVGDIMKQAEATLYEHDAGSGSIYMCWMVEKQLQEIFTAAEDAIEIHRPIPRIHDARQPVDKTLGTESPHVKR